MASPTIGKAPSASDPKTLPRTMNAIDIEHVPVHDDPRQWSHARKVRVKHSALTGQYNDQCVGRNFIYCLSGHNAVFTDG